MTIRIPDDGNGKPDNSYGLGNFASAWPQHHHHHQDHHRRDHQMNQPNNGFTSFTGVRVTMAGELLNGMMNEDSSIESQEIFDTVELGARNQQIKAAGKIKHHAENRTKKPDPPPMISSPNKETYDTYETSSDEEDARIDAHRVEIIFGQTERGRIRLAEEEERKKQLKYDRLRCWKSPEKMVALFTVIMIMFILLAFWERIFGRKFLSWDANQ